MWMDHLEMFEGMIQESRTPGKSKPGYVETRRIQLRRLRNIQRYGKSIPYLNVVNASGEEERRVRFVPTSQIQWCFPRLRRRSPRKDTVAHFVIVLLTSRRRMNWIRQDFTYPGISPSEVRNRGHASTQYPTFRSRWRLHST